MKNKIIVGIIGLMIIVAVFAGFIFVFDRIEETFDEDDTTKATETTKASDSTVLDTSTSAPSTSAPSDSVGSNIVYDTTYEEAIGYSVINDYTYFFFYYDNPYPETMYWNSNVSASEELRIRPFANYDVYIASSYDGISWDLADSSYFEYPVRVDDRLFVSYTRIKDCKNPDYVLEDLKQNVFSNDYYWFWDLDDTVGDDISS